MPHVVSDRFAIRTAILAAAIFMIPVAGNNPAGAVEIIAPNGVVELFTSQGCSSCPAADAILTEIAEGGQTLALAWHVDYWDYLGWKDTFAARANTDRQRAYARSFGEAQVYTPQAVVNGRTHVVGSHRDSLLATVDKLAAAGDGLTVPIETHSSGDFLKVKIVHSPQSAGATLWMIYFKDHAEVAISRGENGGHKLGYSNIVEAVEMIGMIKDQDLQAEFNLRDLGGRGHDSCALVLQTTTSQGTPGPILGAAIINYLDR